MANLNKVLRSEISRVSRKEVHQVMGEIKKSSAVLKKAVASLKKRVSFLEKENKRLAAKEKRPKAVTVDARMEEGSKARITSKGVRSLRKKLGLTRPQFAKLVGATSNSVYMWENKAGALKLREATRAALLSIRGLGAREAKRRIAGEEPKE
jgi:DNA-binding transcriptional regulator YiaG